MKSGEKSIAFSPVTHSAHTEDSFEKIEHILWMGTCFALCHSQVIL